jgi:hypothetical protein
MELAPGLKIGSATRSFTVGPRFVETMGMTLLEGRDFRRADRFGTPLVAVVTESFARDFYPGESAVGKRFGYGPSKPNAVEIVGVVKDVKHKQLREAATRTMYTAALQDPGSWRDTTLNVRTAIDPARAAPSLRQAIAEVAPSLPVFNVATLQRMFDDRSLPSGHWLCYPASLAFLHSCWRRLDYMVFLRTRSRSGGMRSVFG